MTNTAEKEIVWKKNEKSDSYSCKGFNTIKHLPKVDVYRVDYVWYNLFDEKVEDSQCFDTLEEAQKFSSLFPKNERIELYEVFYRLRQANLKI